MKSGSGSHSIEPAQEKSKHLLDILNKALANPETFDPVASELSERGSIAIVVKMNILSAGN